MRHGCPRCGFETDEDGSCLECGAEPGGQLDVLSGDGHVLLVVEDDGNVTPHSISPDAALALSEALRQASHSARKDGL